MDKLKIFISGTQDDMLSERDAVTRAIDKVALGEDTRAEKTLSQINPPREWIIDQIFNCSVYIGLYSHRYGWVIPEEKVSATEFEFNLACEYRKPILLWIRQLRPEEKSLPNFDRQQQFLKRVSDFSTGYVRQEFTNVDDLEKWVANALRDTFIKIIRSETGYRRQLSGPPIASLLHAYLQEISNKKAYVLWDEGNYIDRKIAGTTDLFARNVIPHANEDQRAIKPKPLEDVLRREEQLVLLGAPGLGKTTSLLHLAWEAANRSLYLTESVLASEVEIPVYVELKYYKGEAEAETLIARQMNNVLRARKKMLAPDPVESTSVIRTWLMQSSGRFLLLFDGLNEVQPDFYTPVRGMLQGILNSQHRVVIACRERDYDQSLSDHARSFVLEGLQDKEIRDYLWRVLGEKSLSLLYKQIHPDQKMRTLAANPLMLWIISLIARSDTQARLLANRGKLLKQFIELMPKLRAREKVQTSIPVDVVTTTLAKLAFAMQERGKLTVGLGEVRRSGIAMGSWRLDDILACAKEWRFLKSDGAMGEPIEFLHPLFLEYFAAVHLCTELENEQNHSDILTGLLMNDYWAETLVMLTGITNDPKDLLKKLSCQIVVMKKGSAAILLKRCLDASKVVNDIDTRSAVANALIVALKERNLCQAAIQALKSIENVAARPLVSVLNDENESARNYAIEILEGLGIVAAGPLIDALTNEDESVRARAAEILGNIHATVAAEPLIAALKDKCESVRRQAAEALGKIKDARSVGPLIETLNDEAEGVRWYAAEALGKIKDIQAIEPLVAVLEDCCNSMLAAIALGRVGDSRACDQLAHSLRSAYMRRYAARTLGEFPSPIAAQSLIRALKDEDYYVRAYAAEALKGFGRFAIGPLIAGLRDESEELRVYAAEILGHIGDANIPESHTPTVPDKNRAELIKALQKNPVMHTNPAFLASLAYSEYAADTPPEKAEGFRKRFSIMPVAPLIAALKDKCESVRRQAAEALGKIKDARSVGPLIETLNDEAEGVRWYAAEALGKIKDIQAIEPLVAVLEDCCNSMLAAIALGRVGDSRACDQLAHSFDSLRFCRHIIGVINEIINSKPLEGLGDVRRRCEIEACWYNVEKTVSVIIQRVSIRISMHQC